MMDWGNSGRHGAWIAMIWTVSRTQVFSIAEFSLCGRPAAREEEVAMGR